VIEFILEINGVERGFRLQFKLPTQENYKQQLYRALLYYLKARFTSVDFGIRTIEEEFLTELLIKLPDGQIKSVRETIDLSKLITSADLQLPYKT